MRRIPPILPFCREIPEKGAVVPVCEPHLDGNEEKYVLDCLRTNWISSSGHYLKEFEARTAAFCGAPHAVAPARAHVIERPSRA